jgi:hypothetical protein
MSALYRSAEGGGVPIRVADGQPIAGEKPAPITTASVAAPPAGGGSA